MVQALDLSTRALADGEVISGVLFGTKSEAGGDLRVHRGQELSLSTGSTFDATHLDALVSQAQQFDAVSQRARESGLC